MHSLWSYTILQHGGVCIRKHFLRVWVVGTIPIASHLVACGVKRVEGWQQQLCHGSRLAAEEHQQEELHVRPDVAMLVTAQEARPGPMQHLMMHARPSRSRHDTCMMRLQCD